MKPKGINISFIDLLKAIGKKVAKVDKSELDKIIKEEENGKVFHDK